MRSNYQYNFKFTPTHTRLPPRPQQKQSFTRQGAYQLPSYSKAAPKTSHYSHYTEALPSQQLKQSASAEILKFSGLRPNTMQHVQSTNALSSNNSARISHLRNKEPQMKIMARVKALQQQVEPMLHNNSDEAETVGLQVRIQRSINRMQGQMEELAKELQLEMEKKLLDLQTMMEARFERIIQSKMCKKQ